MKILKIIGSPPQNISSYAYALIRSSCKKMVHSKNFKFSLLFEILAKLATARQSENL